MDQIEAIVREVLSRLNQTPSVSEPALAIPVETSARHVHLSREDLKSLFGLEELECVRKISQPGQFLSGCRVRLIGPKGTLENVAVLGPIRAKTQVEISATDARQLGIQAPVRLSGDLDGAASIFLQAGDQLIQREAAIVARRHIHMTPGDAAAFGVKDRACVSVRVEGTRPLILEEVPVRVTDASALALHIDTDEANACGAGKGCVCRIVSSGCAPYAQACASQVPAAPAASCAKTIEEKLITEEMIRKLSKDGVTSLCLKPGQLITPLARDTAKALSITLNYGG